MFLWFPVNSKLKGEFLHGAFKVLCELALVFLSGFHLNCSTNQLAVSSNTPQIILEPAHTLLLQPTCLPLRLSLGAMTSKKAALDFSPDPLTGWDTFWWFCYSLEMSLLRIFHASIIICLCGCHPYQIVSYFMTKNKLSIMPMA